MKIFYISLIVSLPFSFEAIAQSERYVCRNDDGYSSDWIELFDNGRFELIHDEQCYAYSNGAGVYKVSIGSIQLEFFKSFDSKKEVTEIVSADRKVDVTIQVFSLQDSSIIRTATVFARDTTRQKFDLKQPVDSNGVKKFSIPKGKTIKYLRVSANQYIDCVLTFDERYDTDYTIKIFLSEDPLQKVDYDGITSRSGKMVRKGKNKILYNGRTYKKVKE